MNRHIRILAGGKETTLPDDFALDLELVNPLFNDNVQSGSLPFNIPLDGNRHLVQNMEDVKSDVRVTDVEHTPCVVMVDDVPYHSGEIVVSEDQELKDSLDASINSYIRSLDDLIQDMECWDVPVKDKIQIGECLGDVTPDYQFRGTIRATVMYDYGLGGVNLFSTVYSSELSQGGVILPPSGFSVPYEKEGDDIVQDFINVSTPYPLMPYCNARVCYPNKRLSSDDSSSSNAIDEDEPMRVLDAKRPGSGICFYVLYFLDCLFDYLHLSYSSHDLAVVDDMCRLAFYTTHCKYDEERKYADRDYYDLVGAAEINDWLKSMETDLIKTARIKENKIQAPTSTWDDAKLLNKASFDCAATFPRESATTFVGKRIDAIKGRNVVVNGRKHVKKVTDIRVGVAEVEGNLYANIMKMYANNKNFPETSVANIIDSLWASFGIKFVLDSERRKVTPYYIRDVLRDDESARMLRGTILTIGKKTEKITGFRMRYAAESDPKDQSKNVRNGVRDYETAFNYLMSASPIVDDKHYEDLVMTNGGIADINCYVDKRTGNAYRWKVDKEAKTEDDARVNLFEVASYKGISKGDCSQKNEDFIEDVTSDFEPVVFSEVNNTLSKDAQEYENVFSAFADEDMLNSADECIIHFAMGNEYADYSIDAQINTEEKWDTSATEEGDSPLQSYDWGNSIAVMRGGGSDARIQYYDYDYDGFGNSKYRMVSGAYAMTSDSMDNYGNQYDYVPDESDESTDDFGSGERFSLKITAYKHDEQGNPLTDEQGNILCQDDVKDAQGNIITKIRSRGLFDTFMSEYAHFLLNRKVLVIRMLCEVAELVDIPNHWNKRWKIGEHVGWINKVKTHVTMSAGLEEVEVEMYCL